MRRIYNEVGMLGVPAPLNEKAKEITPRVLNYVFAAVVALYQKINGFISLGTGENGSNAGNLDAHYIDHTFITIDQNETMLHRLGRVPVGYLVCRKSAAGQVYDTDSGSWTDTVIILKCNAGSTVRLLVF